MNINKTKTNGRYYRMVEHVSKSRPQNGQDRGSFNRQVIRDKINVLVAELSSTTDIRYANELRATITELKEYLHTLEEMDLNSQENRNGNNVTYIDDDTVDEFSTVLDRAIAERAKSNHINGFISHERYDQIRKNLEGK